MTKVYLHIGLPKTGTATIQNWLTANARTLRKAGVFTFDDATFGHRLAIEAMSDETRDNRSDLNAVVNGTPLNEVTNQLANLARDKTLQAAIVSSEYFSLADPKTVKQLLFDVSLEDVSIILVLRRQDRFIEANYGQDIAKARGSNALEDPVYQPHCDWLALTRAWTEAFSPDALLLHTHEKASGDRRIVERVIGSLNDRVAMVVADTPAPAEKGNETLPAELVKFERLADRAGTPDVLDFLERAAKAGIGGVPFRMSSERAKSVLDLYRESNRQLSKEFFGRNGELFDESDLNEESEGSDCTEKLSVETLAALLAFHVQEVKRVQAEAADLERWLLDSNQSVKSACGWAQADLLALKEDIKNQLAQLPARVRHEAAISVEPLYREVQAQGERVARIRGRVGRLEDLTSPKRLVQIGWSRLTTRLRRT